MNIEPVAYYRGPLTSKFGIPRQSGLAPALLGHIVFTPQYAHEEAVRGLERFDFLWLIWEFSANNEVASKTSLTVRPPRLGGNERVGVFASRSPFRPNRLGLSCVHINKVVILEGGVPVVFVEGADLMDGTPIYDIKPYVAFSDAHADARSGFVDDHEWRMLKVVIPIDLATMFTDEEQRQLSEVLAQDPRPQYHDDPQRIYGMAFAGRDVRFRVCNGEAIVVAVN